MELGLEKTNMVCFSGLSSIMALWLDPVEYSRCRVDTGALDSNFEKRNREAGRVQDPHEEPRRLPALRNKRKVSTHTDHIHQRAPRLNAGSWTAAQIHSRPKLFQLGSARVAINGRVDRKL